MSTWFSSSLTFDAYLKPAPDFKWTKEYFRTLRKSVSEMRPPKDTIGKPMFAVLGPASAGKSAFINSVASICKNNIEHPAIPGFDGNGQITLIYRRYRFLSGFLANLVLSDASGLTSADKDSLTDTINTLVKGQLKEGYDFELEKKGETQEDFHMSNPTEEDKTQCVIFVLDITKPIAAGIPYFKHINTICKELRKLGIPHIAVLSKVDLLCPFVKRNINYIYHSKAVRAKIHALHEVTGMPLSHIFPIKNYADEQYTDDMKNIPILVALKRAFDFANCYLEQLRARDEKRFDDTEGKSTTQQKPK